MKRRLGWLGVVVWSCGAPVQGPADATDLPVLTDSAPAACEPTPEDAFGDGIDSNCDGVDGVDADGDGVPANGEPADCQDGDAAVFPGADDVVGDDVDADCDGFDGIDRDGDGWPANADHLPDCDDADPTRHPGVLERSGAVCEDGIDNDCDGLADREDRSCPQPPVCGTEPPRCTSLSPWAEVTECSGFVAGHSGWQDRYEAVGIAWGDVDGDGWVDLYVTHNNGPNHLYRNLGDGTFALFPFASQVALPEQRSGGATFVDVDNDGWKDLFVANLGPNVLYRNLGGTGFEDVTEAAGLGHPGEAESAGWGDFDNDGDLDLYVANHDCFTCEDDALNLDQLYRNNGDFTFTNVSEWMDPLLRSGMAFVGTWFDADDDGDVDLWVANDKGNTFAEDRVPLARNALWRNDGPGCGGWCFTEVGRGHGAAIGGIDSMGIAVGDVDLDLDLDLMTTDIGPTRLLLGDGAGDFTDVSAAALPGHLGAGWAVVLRDFTNDGMLEYVVAVDRVTTGARSLLGRPRGDGTFQAYAGTAIAKPLDAYGLGVADYDRDGWMDLVVGYETYYGLFRNTRGACDAHHWLSVRLEGRGPVNRDAVGTRVDVTRTDGVVIRRDVVLGSGLGAGHDLALHVGLGTADVASVHIRWPDGTEETLTGIARDQEWVHTYSE